VDGGALPGSAVLFSAFGGGGADLAAEIAENPRDPLLKAGSGVIYQ